MGGLKHISTYEEKKISKLLTAKRAKVFLESRAFMRQCLSHLFNINPLEIPLKAYPGEIPKIPEGMGNISISHTKNILILIWHEEKIGIDIEESKRKFNYQGIAKKYFQNTKGMKSTKKINQKDILNYWSAIEAAIKCDGGKLSQDLKHWKLIKGKNKDKIYHANKELKLQLNQFEYKQWIISITNKKRFFSNDDLIICENFNDFGSFKCC